MPKKKSKKSENSSTAAVSVLPAAVSVDQGSFENFKREMVSYEVLASALNEGRCIKFNELLRDIASPELQTRLLNLAYCFNDADAIQVLLRANQFLDKDISIFHCHTFLNKHLYYSVDFQEDEKAKVVSSRLKEIYSQRLDKLTCDDLKKIIRHPAFQLKDIQDEYLINKLFLAFLEIGEETDLSYLRQDLFVHACTMGFKAVVDFCIRSQVLPDLDRVPLVTATHSPLAYYALSSQVNKKDIKTYLLEKWNKDISLSPVSAFELLALCYLLGDLEDIKTQLHAYLKGQDIKAVLPQLLVGDLFIPFVEHNPEIRQEWSCEYFQIVIKNTLSAGLFKWAHDYFIQEFNVGNCVGNIIEKFNEELNSLNGLDEQYFLRQYADFFESILGLAIENNAGYVEFLLALFIVENREAAFSVIAKRYSDILKELLSGNFSELISLRFFKVESIYPLKAALSYDSRDVALSMYRYMYQHELLVSAEAVGNFSSDLLNILMNEPKPDHSFISYFLKNFPEVYCDTLTVEKLLALCLEPILPKPDLLLQVVFLAAHYFYDEFFNLRNPHFDEKQLKSLHDTFDALTKDLERSEDVRKDCNAIRLKLLAALSWEKLKNDPLKGSSDETMVRDRDLHYLCDAIRLAETVDKKQSCQDLAIRRIMHLHKINPGLLKSELSEVKSYSGMLADSSKYFCTPMGLLARSETSDDILSLLLILCPDLDFNESSAPDFFRLFSMLCYSGHANIIEQFIEYVTRKESVFLCLQLFYGVFSPVYIAAKYGFKVEFKGFKDKFRAISLPEVFSSYSNTAKIQVAAYFDGNLDNQEEFQEIIQRLKSGIKWTMLPVAMGLRDSVLVLTALKVDHDNQIPSDQREELIKLLFLSPNLKLLSLLKLEPAEILLKRSYSEAGYLIGMDGLNFCLSRLEIAVNSGWRKPAIDYCGLVANLFEKVEVSPYQLEVFLSLLKRISAMSVSCQKAAEQCCSQIFSYEKLALLRLKLNKKLIDFVNHAMKVMPVENNAFIRWLRLKKRLAKLGHAVNEASLPAVSAIDNDELSVLLSRNQYLEAEKLLQAGAPVSDTVPVAQLCRLLVSSDFSFGVRKQLVDALRRRIQSCPDELKNENHYFFSLCSLIELQEEELVTILLNMDKERFSLGNAPDKIRLFVESCEQGFSLATLERMIERIPKKILKNLDKVVTLSSSRGSSPLYVFYQITQRKDCIDFLLNNFERLNNCSDFNLLELLALVVGWLQDKRYAKEYKEKLKAIESKLLALMEAREIHIITALRQYYSLNPRVFVILLSNNPILIKQVEDAKIEWFFNAALYQLHVPSIEKICQNIKSLRFSFDLMRIYHWIDGTDPSTPLVKIFQSMANKKESIDETIAILMALLAVVEVDTPAAQSELKNILIKLIYSERAIMKIVMSLSLSQEIIKELLEIAQQHKHSEVLSLGDFYGERYPGALEILVGDATEGYQKEQGSASSAQQPEEETKELEELIEQQQVAEEDKRRDNDRRQAKQDDVNSRIVNPLSFLHATVIDLTFSEEAELSDLQLLQGNIDTYRAECVDLIELASEEDGEFVGHLLEDFNIQKNGILEKLQGLEIQVDAKIKEYRCAAEELDRKRLAEKERRRQEASLLAKQKKLEQEQLAKERKLQEEQQRSLEKQNEFNSQFIQRLESLERNVEDLYYRIEEAIDKPCVDDKAESRLFVRFKEEISFYNQEYLTFLDDLDEAGKEFVICDLDAYKDKIQFGLNSLKKLDEDVGRKIKEIEQAAKELQQPEALSQEEAKIESKAASEADSSNISESNFHRLVELLKSLKPELDILAAGVTRAMNFQGVDSSNFSPLKSRIIYYYQIFVEIDLELNKEKESGKDVGNFKDLVAKTLVWLRVRNDEIDNRARQIDFANQKRQQEEESKLVAEKESRRALDEMQGQSSEQVQMQQDMAVNYTLFFFDNMIESLLELVEIAKDPWVDLRNLQRLKKSIGFYCQKYAEVRRGLSQKNLERFNSRIDSQLRLLVAADDHFKNYHTTEKKEVYDERQGQLSKEIEEIEDQKQACNILFFLNIELNQLGYKVGMAVCFHESGSDNLAVLKETIVSLRKHYQEIQQILVCDFDELTPEELEFFDNWVSVSLKFLDRMDAEIDLETKIRFLRGNVTNLVENVKGMSCKNAEELELLKTKVGRFKLSCVLLRKVTPMSRPKPKNFLDHSSHHKVNSNFLSCSKYTSAGLL